MSLWKTFPSTSTQVAQLAVSWILFVAIFYMLCAIIRLARFNVENDTDLAHHQNFAGLPSPAAAGVVVSLVIFQEDFLKNFIKRFSGLSSSLMDITSWMLPLAVLLCGILMVTRIRYPHLTNRLLRRKKSFVSVLLVLFISLFAVWNIQITVFLGFWGFMIIGLIRSLYGSITRKIVKSGPNR